MAEVMTDEEKAIREKVAEEIGSNLKALMENLCGLGRDGYSKVDGWHAGVMASIVGGPTISSEISTYIEDTLRNLRKRLPTLKIKYEYREVDRLYLFVVNKEFEDHHLIHQADVNIDAHVTNLDKSRVVIFVAEGDPDYQIED